MCAEIRSTALVLGVGRNLLMDFMLKKGKKEKTSCVRHEINIWD